ncbi:unnamed protein product [Penicillium egyptiacum]|uniref:F-box domain-containing protein n=1 Tax=Penicillium egyptiacum TaxID=1303716 RepID=A0A9W4KIZ3_9EURO|nr:unnamed protein product [Penicillium egyptiacum]
MSGTMATNPLSSILHARLLQSMQALGALVILLLLCIRRKSNSQFVIPKPNTLNGLPVELILLISDLLSPEDILCLSMCDHRLFGALSRKRNFLPLVASDKLPFLHRIERDLPGYFVCHCCFLLHEFDGSERFAMSGIRLEWRSRLPCVSGWKWETVGLEMRIHNLMLHTDYRLYFLQLQLVMRRFYCGDQFGLSTESLHHTQVIEKAEETILFSIEARICLEQIGLCLRIQDIMLVEDRKLDLVAPKKSILPPLFFWICGHLSHLKLLVLVQSMLSTYVPGNSTLLLRSSCDKCKTDFDLELREDGDDLALILTRWINLGPGLSPNDPQWKAHSRTLGYMEPDTVELDMAVSPRVSFETACDISKETLRSRNLSYLKVKRYKELMRQIRGYHKTWSFPRD